MSAKKFGKFLQCPKGAVAGACTSGAKEECRDNKHEWNAHKIFCNTTVKVDTKKCTMHLQKSNHELIQCDAGQVIVGRSASGAKADVTYKGEHGFSLIKCCDVHTSTMDSLVDASIPDPNATTKK